MNQQVADAQEQLLRDKMILTRALAVRQARDKIVPFMKLMMPDPLDPDDASKSRFVGGWHHDILAEKLQELEKGNIKRLIITMPPRHSKSETCTRNFPAYFMGKHPSSQIIIAGYSETFAQEEFGREIRAIMTSPQYGQVFPGTELDRNSKSAGFMMTSKRGKISVTGVGGKTTGKGADLLIIDDPIKNAASADSETERNNMWNWYMTTARTRLQPGGRILIVMTRWHEDDLVGRILDPETNSQETIDQWEILHLPALRDPIDGMASRNDETSVALWPNWQPKEELLTIKRDVAPRVWSALYQGSPTPEDGEYFTRGMIQEYGRGCKHEKAPPLEELRVYQAMDLAVSQKKAHDASCLLTVGVDAQDNIWVLDVMWERRPADSLIDALLYEMQRYNPIIAWGETGQISKSIGPFMRKRMVELGIYAYIEENTPVVDKTVRSRSIRARMAMGKVFFPKDAIWFEDAVSELVKFPAGKHDDFVDCLSWIGMGLEREVGHMPQTVVKKVEPGSVAWIKQQSKIEQDFKKTMEGAEW